MSAQTDGLSLPLPVAIRPAAAEDARHLYRWRSEESVQRYQPLRNVSLAQLRADLQNHPIGDLYRARGDRFVWIVEARGDPCGWITLLVNNSEHGLAEVGYALTSNHQAQGVMPRALGILLPELFLRTPLERIEARCAVGNEASYKVLERCGFVCEGRLRDYFKLHGERVDHHLFALLRRDFLPL